MKPNHKSHARPTRDEVIRARCSSVLRSRLERIASIREVDLSDILREACATYANTFEHRLTA